MVWNLFTFFFLVLILLNGLFINGPYALITTAVANDLVCSNTAHHSLNNGVFSSQGTHKVLTENQKAKATVSGIIDATGSIGTVLVIFCAEMFIFAF